MKYRKLSELKKLENNPRTIKKEQMETLVQSIRDNQDYFEARPLILSNRTGELVILGGNQRYEAAKIIGLDKVPTHLIENLTEGREQEIIIRDNVENGEWNWDVLANEWEQEQLEEWGLDTKQNWESPEIEEDEAPEVSDEPPVSKLGEVYQLGRHRVMCGDSTKIEDVERLMDGNKADVVFTDPPYGMDLDTDYSKLPDSNRMGKAKTYSKVIGDSEEFNPIFILNTFDYCNEIVMFGADYYADKLPKGGSWYVWDKRVDEKFDKMIGSAFELAWSKTKHKREIARFNNTLFSGESDAKNKVHPTQKPLKMLVWFLNRLKGDNVVDLFLGSGSTLIACEQTDRTCYGMELDPKYVDVIRKRYWRFTHDNNEEGWELGTLGE